MYIGPGEPAQVLHRDANNWWEFVSRTWPDSPEVTLSAMIGLEGVTEELGATRVVPGSHKNAEIQRFGEADSVPPSSAPGTRSSIRGTCSTEAAPIAPIAGVERCI